jgi:hypothetical protein
MGLNGASERVAVIGSMNAGIAATGWPSIGGRAAAAPATANTGAAGPPRAADAADWAGAEATTSVPAATSSFVRPVFTECG